MGTPKNTVSNYREHDFDITLQNIEKSLYWFSHSKIAQEDHYHYLLIRLLYRKDFTMANPRTLSTLYFRSELAEAKYYAPICVPPLCKFSWICICRVSQLHL